MAKAPAFQFYPGDWSRDLEEHPLEIEGAWIRICCKLWWSETRGKLERTIEQWAKILRVYPQDAERILKYVELYKIGDVLRDPNGNLTVISRRMIRDEKDRESNCLRQKRHYEKRKPNATLTPTSQASSSSSLKEKKKEKKILSDDEWLKTLEERPVYRGIDVRALYEKMLVWCENNRKNPSRRRFVNWMNNEDKPMSGKVSQKKSHLPRPSDIPNADEEARQILARAAGGSL